MDFKISTESAKDWLRYIQNRNEPLSWLVPYESNLLSVLEHGLSWEPTFRESFELLTTVFSYFALTLSHTEAWPPLLRDALLMAQDIRDNDLQTTVFRWMGEAYLKVGKHEAARKAFSTALDRSETGNINDMKVAVYTGLFKLEWFDLKQNLTQTLVQQALETVKLIEDRALQADFYDALAPAYARKMDTASALGYGQTALAYWKSVNNNSGIGRTAYTLASVYIHIAQIKEDKRFLNNAISHLELARDVLSRTDEVWQYALLAYQQATIYFQLEEYESASSWFRQSLNEATNTNTPQYVVVAQHGLGLALSRLREFSQARQYLQSALKHWQELQNNYEQANVFIGLADLELSAENKELAKFYVQDGLQCAMEIADPKMRDFMKLQYEEVVGRLLP